MSTTYPGSPRTARAALVILALPAQSQTLIPLQYNPHTLTRSFEIAQATSGVELGQLTGPPAETIKFEAELDANDLDGEVRHGVLPLIAALEGLITPRAAAAELRASLAASGSLEIIPSNNSLTLFVWGSSRVIPVVVKELSITEEAFDVDLTPIRARASIGLRVLGWDQLHAGSPGFSLAVSQQLGRERLAELAHASASALSHDL